ncbi:MAG: carboxylating nicotinate-nucleotide diphosphorylase [Firmicutes bacterium]|nr:carboxylating nicotinate-nucleotide diphosphorylase [Bacillota bacterium]
MLPAWILDEVVHRALAEDIGTGDLTTDSLVPAGAEAEAVIHSKSTGVLAGLPVAARVFRVLDPDIRVEEQIPEGSFIRPGSIIARVRGRARAVLTGERVALNFLQRLSGIATATRHLVELIAGTRARLVDTRKTAPGLRVLEKYAVRIGGGCNHRIGLYDGILIKDNHIKVAGGIAEAVRRARAAVPHTIKIEIEVETLEQLEEALAAGADLIMLDNMPLPLLRKAVALAGGRVPLEASGGITAERIREVAETGVDFISVGAITHSAPALDISMDVGEIKGARKSG